jgi:hypothetical protein
VGSAVVRYLKHLCNDRQRVMLSLTLRTQLNLTFSQTIIKAFFQCVVRRDA